MLPILACGAGMYFGLSISQRHTSGAMLPFSLLGAGAYIVNSWAAGQSILDSASVVFLPLVALQVGYFLGLTTRPAYSLLRARLNIEHSKRV